MYKGYVVEEGRHSENMLECSSLFPKAMFIMSQFTFTPKKLYTILLNIVCVFVVSLCFSCEEEDITQTNMSPSESVIRNIEVVIKNPAVSSPGGRTLHGESTMDGEIITLNLNEIEVKAALKGIYVETEFEDYYGENIHGFFREYELSGEVVIDGQIETIEDVRFGIMLFIDVEEKRLEQGFVVIANVHTTEGPNGESEIEYNGGYYEILPESIQTFTFDEESSTFAFQSNGDAELYLLDEGEEEYPEILDISLNIEGIFLPKAIPLQSISLTLDHSEITSPNSSSSTSSTARTLHDDHEDHIEIEEESALISINGEKSLFSLVDSTYYTGDLLEFLEDTNEERHGFVRVYEISNATLEATQIGVVTIIDPNQATLEGLFWGVHLPFEYGSKIRYAIYQASLDDVEGFNYDPSTRAFTFQYRGSAKVVEFGEGSEEFFPTSIDGLALSLEGKASKGTPKDEEEEEEDYSDEALQSIDISASVNQGLGVTRSNVSINDQFVSLLQNTFSIYPASTATQ